MLLWITFLIFMDVRQLTCSSDVDDFFLQGEVLAENFRNNFQTAKDKAMQDIKNNLYKYEHLNTHDLIGNTGEDLLDTEAFLKSVRKDKFKHRDGDQIPAKYYHHRNGIRPERRRRKCRLAKSRRRRKRPKEKRTEEIPPQDTVSLKIEQLLSRLYEAEAKVRRNSADKKLKVHLEEDNRAQENAAVQQSRLKKATQDVQTLTDELRVAKAIAKTAAENAKTAQENLKKQDKLLLKDKKEVSQLIQELAKLESELVGKVVSDIDLLQEPEATTTTAPVTATAPVTTTAPGTTTSTSATGTSTAETMCTGSSVTSSATGTTDIFYKPPEMLYS